MLNQLERWIFFYDMALHPVPEDAPDMPMVDVMGLAEQLWREGEAVWLFQKKTAALRIQDVVHHPDKEAYVMLISYADQNVSDPVFSDLETGDLRVEPKLQGEGVAISAHLVISTKKRAPGEAVYLCLLEDVPGVGRTKLRSFLTSIFRKSSNFTFDTEDGRELKCRPSAEMAGHMSQTFQEDLASGSAIKGFELIQYERGAEEWDEPEYLKERKRQVVIDVKRDVPADVAIDLANRLKGKARNSGYTDMRIRYKRPEGKQKSILMGTAREDAADAISIRSELLTVEEPLNQCSDEIRTELADQMLDKLVAERD